LLDRHPADQGFFEGEAMATDAGNLLEHLDTFCDDLWPDAVARQHCDLGFHRSDLLSN
jgi:hypothetical protein